MKCTLCKKNIETTFLGKLIGTYARDKKGKKKAVCNACQSKNKDIRKKVS